MKPMTKAALCFLMGLGVLYVSYPLTGQLIVFANHTHSTGICCIVRTVLNFESVPKDFTCMFQGICNIAQ